MRTVQRIKRFGRSIVAGVSLAAIMAGQVLATGHLVGGDSDYSADLTTGLVGFVAGAAASIAVAVAVAMLLRVTWKGARIALKAFGLIK